MPVESNHTWGWPCVPVRCGSSGYGLPDNREHVVC